MFLSVLTVGRGQSAAPTRKPTPGELQRVQDRLIDRVQRLSRFGVWSPSSHIDYGRCVVAEFVNPTPRSVALTWLAMDRDRRLCFDDEPVRGGLIACGLSLLRRNPVGAVRVPDVRGLRLRAAEARLLDTRLRFSVACLGVPEDRLTPLNGFEPIGLARVTRQCPLPGQAVRAGTEVALDALADLGRGHTYALGSLGQSDAETACADGRDP